MTKEEIRKYKREWAKKKYHSNILEARKEGLEKYYKNREKMQERNRKWKKEHKEDVKKYNHCYLEKNREVIYKRRNKYVAEKTGYAVAKVEEAIRSGKMVRLSCEICGEEKAEAHHDNYNNPLEVRWLCKKCHTEWHRNNTPIYIRKGLEAV